MEFWRQIDIYCERTDPGLWSEPANAVTNLAFLVAAVLVWRRGAGAPPPSGQDARILGALIAAIGVGSGLFHTLATVWAAWLDSGLIALYIYVWLARFLARVAGLRWTGVIAGLVAFAILSRGLTVLFSPGSLNGSYSYFPALIALAACGGYAWREGHPGAPRLGVAAGVFVVSLVLRSIDQTLCDTWPLGTHFIWHCLNSVVLYLTATALDRPSAERAA
jgi:hypothetical protein